MEEFRHGWVRDTLMMSLGAVSFHLMVWFCLVLLMTVGFIIGFHMVPKWLQAASDLHPPKSKSILKKPTHAQLGAVMKTV